MRVLFARCEAAQEDGISIRRGQLSLTLSIVPPFISTSFGDAEPELKRAFILSTLSWRAELAKRTMSEEGGTTLFTVRDTLISPEAILIMVIMKALDKHQDGKR